MTSSFFDPSYPQVKQRANQQPKVSRRQVLKSAFGASVIGAGVGLGGSALSLKVLAQNSQKLAEAKLSDPWLTLDAVLNHLLPESATGPSAQEIQALNYLYNLIYQQPTEQSEIDFIFKGVGWLNDYSQSQHQQNFIALTLDEKETLLRGISQSRAGENWLNTLLEYIFEAMLTPPAYGGNPNGIGWQWLEHQGGFPLPTAGTRYYELPGQQKITITMKPSIEMQQTPQELQVAVHASKIKSERKS